jgi:glycine cleavage system H lipoate-binding protein
MTVLLIILTFAVFILVDWLLHRKRQPAVRMTEAQAPAQTIEDEILFGFHVPKGLKYHPGHTWLLRERKNVQLIGLDEFAAVFAGPVEKLELPKAGHWIRQGQKIVKLTRAGETIELVSPVEGEVTEINAEVIADPSLLRQDPYGQGWLMRVFAPDEEGPGRNLLPTHLIAAWMRDAAERLYGLQPQLAGATAADGGRLSKNATDEVDLALWKKTAREVFLN